MAPADTRVAILEKADYSVSSVVTNDGAMTLLETEHFALVLIGRQSESLGLALDQRLREKYPKLAVLKIQPRGDAVSEYPSRTTDALPEHVVDALKRYVGLTPTSRHNYGLASTSAAPHPLATQTIHRHRIASLDILRGLNIALMIIPSVVFGFLSLLAARLLYPFGNSKIRATPSWSAAQRGSQSERTELVICSRLMLINSRTSLCQAWPSPSRATIVPPTTTVRFT